MNQPPVILLHGWGGSFATTFRKVGWITELDRIGRETVAIDLPGHADPEASTDPSDYADMAGDVARRIRLTLGIAPRCEIIGYSLGAKLAMAIALAEPQAVGRLVLVGVGDNALRPEPMATSVIAALERGIETETPVFARHLVEYCAASGSRPEALAAVLRRPANPTFRPEELAAIGPRTLLINSAVDDVAMPDTSLRAALRGHVYTGLAQPAHVALPACRNVIDAATAFLCAKGEIYS